MSMSKKYSPFAALSSREQQERWLEFQNTRLPYINGEVDMTLSEKDADWLGKHIEKIEPPAPAKNSPTPHMGNRNLMGQVDDGQRNAQSFQKTTHRQYDAVIRRMMEAEKQARQFQASSV